MRCGDWSTHSRNESDTLPTLDVEFFLDASRTFKFLEFIKFVPRNENAIHNQPAKSPLLAKLLHPPHALESKLASRLLDGNEFGYELL